MVALTTRLFYLILVLTGGLSKKHSLVILVLAKIGKQCKYLIAFILLYLQMIC